MYENPWKYSGIVFNSEDINDYIGFVYIITNKSDGRKYIGKKLFWSSKTKVINKKKKRFKVESDWKKYYGSSDELKADVHKLGPENFDRKIIRLCKTKGECSYYEAKEQFLTDAVLSEDYYNVWMSVTVRKNHVKP